jgi:hypothetical protein
MAYPSRPSSSSLEDEDQFPSRTLTRRVYGFEVAVKGFSIGDMERPRIGYVELGWRYTPTSAPIPCPPTGMGSRPLRSSTSGARMGSLLSLIRVKPGLSVGATGSVPQLRIGYARPFRQGSVKGGKYWR